MSQNLFGVKSHLVPCQHIREYPGALLGEQEDVLQLAVKQYIPLENIEPKKGDVTIIGAHANGFPKELYEPLWEDILCRSRREGFRIRSIWIADFACQGDSGVVNEGILGNDPSWHDHTRDLLHLINLKRDEMPRPIAGVGHSFGGNSLARLSLIHPRLFTSLILLDPVIARQDPEGDREVSSIAKLSALRKDLWQSREEAATWFAKSKFYARWDPRVLDRWLWHGLRDVPTKLYPKLADGDSRVTLKTPKHQEVFTFVRPNIVISSRVNNIAALDAFTQDETPSKAGAPVRPEVQQVFDQMVYMQPSVLFIYGSESNFTRPSGRDELVARTGTGIGGNGGKAAGRVEDVLLDGVGHLVAMEAVHQCADTITAFLGRNLMRWSNEEENFRHMWSSRSSTEKTTVSNQWLNVLDQAAQVNEAKRTTRSKL